jgi:hypothetical protein
MTDRRYSEAEVAEIFKQAAEAQHTGRRQLPAGEGMTLADLQEIGREVGIPKELVESAARGIDRAGAPAGRRFLGLPLGVGRSVELERRLTDAEWERLVVDLRETFDARGKVTSDGSFRQWTNGNLQALLEPTPTGQQLRLRTFHGNARGMMLAGLAMIGFAFALSIPAAVVSGFADAAPLFMILSLTGAGLFGIGALRLPRWAQNRARQMEGVASRLVLAAREGPAEVPPDPEPLP